MFSKLAFKNVRKSIRDFSIYFITLTFGVCIFYTFNSIGSQQVMFDLNQYKNEYVEALKIVLNYVSVFVSVILAFLILYATSYLIRRRKKEFGIYMTLGMPKGKIAAILMGETFFIGIFALITGLILGVFASQAMSILTAKVFEVQMKQFVFVLSKDGLIKTILYFSIIFLLAMLLQIFIVSKSKLIDLIHAQKKNQNMKMKSLWLSVVVFIISIALLGYAYYLLDKVGIMFVDGQFGKLILIGAIGTFLFFFSLAGFLLKIVQTNKSFYFKNLNMFVLRQVNAKVNTNFISMGLICLMLLCAIGISATAFGLGEGISNSVNDMAPFEVSASAVNHKKRAQPADIKAVVEKAGYNLDEKLESYHVYNIYMPEKTNTIDMQNIANKYGVDLSPAYSPGGVPVITKLSDYNRAMSLLNREGITLAEDEYLIICKNEGFMKTAENFVKQDGQIKIGKNIYKAKQQNAITVSTARNDLSGADIDFVFPDSVLENNASEFTQFSQILVGNYKAKDKIAADEDFYKVFSNDFTVDLFKNHNIDFTVTNALMLHEAMLGTKALFIFVGIYLSFIFMIVSAAILALQQLSEANDSIHRYVLLRKLGVEEKMINRSIFSQIAIYFFIPLSLALVHTFYALNIIARDFEQLGNINISSNMFSSVGIFLLIFAGYFIATYFGYKNIVREGANE